MSAEIHTCMHNEHAHITLHVHPPSQAAEQKDEKREQKREKQRCPSKNFASHFPVELTPLGTAGTLGVIDTPPGVSPQM